VRRVLIVKTGTTLPQLRARRGDYEDWIAEGLGLERERIAVVRADEGEALPDPAAPAGVVVTGSSALVSRREPWSERAAAWLAEALAAQTPILGICYGHQLLAHALGGRVDANPRGREIGTIEVELCEAAAADPLLGGLAPRMTVQATHVESVLELPPGARLLASSAGDPHSAFAVGAAAWGVQFHPEFDADVVRAYLEERRELLRDEGLDADRLLASARDSPHGAALLRRFAALLAP
jgi:GMP synthase (glutamine-hydrolysing)